MSKRKRQSKSVVSTNQVPTSAKAWTDEDKLNLLKALRTHGHTDIDKISNFLPAKSKPAIRLMIYKIMNKAKSSTYNQSPALTAWLESETFDDKTHPIPQALKFISLFEEHPTPDESCDFDFKAAYDYLHRMTLGIPPLDIPADTRKTLNALVEEVKAEVWPASQHEIVGYLGTLITKQKNYKCYPSMKRLEIMKSDYWRYMSGQLQ